MRPVQRRHADVVARNQEERNRVFGMPRDPGQRYPTGEEEQRVMGVPASWFEGADRDWLKSLARPLRRGQEWLRSRRGGRR